jgi:hypothetical protein
MDLKNVNKGLQVAQHLSSKKATNQINMPILVGEMVQNNQKIVGHLGTPNGPETVYKGLQMDGMYGPMS